MPEPSRKIDYLVLGAGLSGLSAGYRLRERLSQQSPSADFLVLEAGNFVGGVIGSKKGMGLTVEKGPNSLVLTPEILQICKDLNIDNQIIYSKGESKIRQILWNDMLHTLHPSPKTIVKTKLLGISAKLRLLAEPFKSSGTDPHESVHDFFARRFGTQVATRLAASIVSGIYAGDARKLEMGSIFPSLVEMERIHGSVLKGVMKRSGAPRQIINFQNGLQTLTDAMAKAIDKQIIVGTSVKSVCKKNEHFEVRVEQNGQSTTYQAQHIISCLPHYAVIDILDEDLLASFPKRNIQYNPMLTMQLLLDPEEARKKTTGFGFLAPPEERKDLIGLMLNGNIFTSAESDTHFLANAFIKPDQTETNDPKQIFESLVRPKLKQWIGIENIELLGHQLWPRAIPQKTTGHSAFLEEINQFEHENTGIYFSGNWRNGVSLGDCVSDNFSLIDRLL